MKPLFFKYSPWEPLHLYRQAPYFPDLRNAEGVMPTFCLKRAAR